MVDLWKRTLPAGSKQPDRGFNNNILYCVIKVESGWCEFGLGQDINAWNLMLCDEMTNAYLTTKVYNRCIGCNKNVHFVPIKMSKVVSCHGMCFIRIKVFYRQAYIKNINLINKRQSILLIKFNYYEFR